MKVNIRGMDYKNLVYSYILIVVAIRGVIGEVVDGRENNYKTMALLQINQNSGGSSHNQLPSPSAEVFQQNHARAAELGLSFIDLESGIIACQYNESSPLKVHNITIICDGKIDCLDGADETNEHCKAECDPPCHDDRGVCLLGTSNLPGRCYCVEGYGGDTCSVEDDNECIVNPCGNYALCTNTLGSFKCDCIPGFSGNGFTCDDINECQLGTHTCNEDEVCFNLQGTYKCGDCPAGTRRKDKVCIDIDECDEGLHSCHADARCLNIPQKFACMCKDGYKGNGTICVDIDECSNPTLNKCHRDASCSNTPGGYNCTCLAGLGDGFDCSNDIGTPKTELILTDVPEEPICEDFCDANAECVRLKQSITALDTKPVCRCKDGFTGNGLVCSDIDECAVNGSLLCGLHKDCINAIGGYVCGCSKGFNLIGAECRNIDECQNPAICPQNSDCVDSLGGYDCVCTQGYEKRGEKCLDVDECETGKDSCPLNAICKNIEGSYECNCHKGFQPLIPPQPLPTPSAVTCADVNECLPTISNDSFNPCEWDLNSECLNTIGSFECRCRSGYYKPRTSLSTTSSKCLDIDECLYGTKPSYDISHGHAIRSLDAADSLCPLNENLLCKNVPGSYKCVCGPGFKAATNILRYDNVVVEVCVDVDECTEYQACRDIKNSRCVNKIGGFECNCLPGFSLNSSLAKTSPGVSWGNIADYKRNKQGITCVDVNECSIYVKQALKKSKHANESTSSPDICRDLDHKQYSRCKNVAGSYECPCMGGFVEIRSIGRLTKVECRDIDECQLNFQETGFQENLLQATFPIEIAKNKTMLEGILKRKLSDIMDLTASPKSFSNNLTTLARLNLIIHGKKRVEKHLCAFFIQGSNCLNTPGSFECHCSTGYYLNSNLLSCQDVNECADSFSLNSSIPKPSQVCSNIPNSQCVNKDGGFDCICIAGYQINPITKTCDDINECASNNPCAPSFNTSVLSSESLAENPLCINTLGSYKCECPPNFKQLTSKKSQSALTNATAGITLCEDVDECNQTSHLCDKYPHTFCHNLRGSYECKCLPGFLNHNKSLNSICEDINECINPVSTNDALTNIYANDCPLRVTNSTCQNTIGGYKCICPRGTLFKAVKTTSANISVYKGSCEDVNECKTIGNGNTNTCYGRHRICVNTYGSYKCACADGFFEKNGKCYDIDECVIGYKFEPIKSNNSVAGNGAPCPSLKHKCINTKSSYKCLCLYGYREELDDHNVSKCLDINECANTPDPCINATRQNQAIKSICINTQGSYKCECVSGYEKKNGICQDINECDNMPCLNISQSHCINTDGSYACVCNDGFQNISSKKNITKWGYECVDIDECQNGNATCDLNVSTCVNHEGGYKCVCKNGYKASRIQVSNSDTKDLSFNKSITKTGLIKQKDENALGLAQNSVLRAQADDEFSNFVCEDINECELDDKHLKASDNITSILKSSSSWSSINYKNLCHGNSRCLNTPGSYRCQCQEGYEGDGAECRDINECLNILPPCGFNSICVNALGSFSCQCLPGYAYSEQHSSLAIEKKSNDTIELAARLCLNINECATTNGNVCDPKTSTCVDTDGGYICECKEGYSLSNESQTNLLGFPYNCVDINKCHTTLPRRCHENAICINKVGSFECQCKGGFVGDGKNCTRKPIIQTTQEINIITFTNPPISNKLPSDQLRKSETKRQSEIINKVPSLPINLTRAKITSTKSPLSNTSLASNLKSKVNQSSLTSIALKFKSNIKHKQASLGSTPISKSTPTNLPINQVKPRPRLNNNVKAVKSLSNYSNKAINESQRNTGKVALAIKKNGTLLHPATLPRIKLSPTLSIIKNEIPKKIIPSKSINTPKNQYIKNVKEKNEKKISPLVKGLDKKKVEPVKIKKSTIVNSSKVIDKIVKKKIESRKNVVNIFSAEELGKKVVQKQSYQSSDAKKVVLISFEKPTVKRIDNSFKKPSLPVNRRASNLTQMIINLSPDTRISPKLDKALNRKEKLASPLKPRILPSKGSSHWTSITNSVAANELVTTTLLPFLVVRKEDTLSGNKQSLKLTKKKDKKDIHEVTDTLLDATSKILFPNNTRTNPDVKILSIKNNQTTAKSRNSAKLAKVVNVSTLGSNSNKTNLTIPKSHWNIIGKAKLLNEDLKRANVSSSTQNRSSTIQEPSLSNSSIQLNSTKSVETKKARIQEVIKEEFNLSLKTNFTSAQIIASKKSSQISTINPLTEIYEMSTYLDLSTFSSFNEDVFSSLEELTTGLTFIYENTSSSQYQDVSEIINLETSSKPSPTTLTDLIKLAKSKNESPSGVANHAKPESGFKMGQINITSSATAVSSRTPGDNLRNKNTILDVFKTKTRLETKFSPLDTEYRVLCYSNSVELLLRVPPNYKAMVYSKKKFNNCQKELKNELNIFADKGVELNFDECGAISNIEDDLLSYTLGIILTDTPPLITKNSKSFSIICNYPIKEINAISELNISLPSLSQMRGRLGDSPNGQISLRNTPPPLHCSMHILDGSKKSIKEASIGEDLMIFLKCSDQAYGLFGFDCAASDASQDINIVPLIDENGCSVDDNLIHSFVKEENSNAIFARFKAFKFPFDSNIRFECRIKPCIGPCNLTKCERNTNGKYKRIKRSSENAIDYKNDIGEILYSVISIRDKSKMPSPEPNYKVLGKDIANQSRRTEEIRKALGNLKSRSKINLTLITRALTNDSDVQQGGLKSLSLSRVCLYPNTILVASGSGAFIIIGILLIGYFYVLYTKKFTHKFKSKDSAPFEKPNSHRYLNIDE